MTINEIYILPMEHVEEFNFTARVLEEEEERFVIDLDKINDQLFDAAFKHIFGHDVDCFRRLTNASFAALYDNYTGDYFVIKDSYTGERFWRCSESVSASLRGILSSPKT